MSPPPKSTDTKGNRPRVILGRSWFDTIATYVRGAFPPGPGITPRGRSRDFGFRTTQCGCRQTVKK